MDTMEYNGTDIYCDVILNGKLPVKVVRETERLLAFYHTKPHWEFHVVCVPKEHVRSIFELKHMFLIGEIFEVLRDIAAEHHLEESYFKIITNGGTTQDSKHLHFHLVSGQLMAK